MITNQFNKHIKSFRSDGGGEFLNNNFRSLFKHLEILHQFTCPHTTSQNGVAERKHRHILETMRSLLIEAHLPKALWEDALHSAVYLINRLPSRSLNKKSPYHILYEKPPSYSHLKIFGCLCYPWLRPYNKSKLSPLSISCIFIGYAPLQKGYRCLNPQTGHVYTSRHEVFNEAIFPYTSPVQAVSPTFARQHIPPLLLVPTFYTSTTTSVSSSAAPYITHSQPIQPHTSISTTDNNINHLQSNMSSNPTSIHMMQTRSKTGHSRPKHILSLAHVTSESDPHTYTEAVRSPHWRNAMSQEFQALQTQGTWDLVPPDPTQNILGCKWIFRTKYLADGTIARYKARLVAQGFNQEQGLDYAETFSPVAKMPTIRVLITIALHHAWPLHQLDVSNAFLHGTLSHTVHMKQPIGFVDSIHPDYVCRLKKALYGLKQSPREWFATLTGHLHSLGFKISSSDPSLLIYNKNGIQMYFLVYVDDIILTGNCSNAIKSLLDNLKTTFTMRDLGSLSQFLGIQTVQTSYGIHLNQSRFAQSKLECAGMSNCKAVSTPSQLKCSTTNDSNASFENPTLYRQLAGCLQYLTLTRPDIAYTVNKVCQHMKNPTNAHFEGLKRLLRYVHGTLHHGLPLYRDKPILRSYADSDWAGDPADRKSTSGYCNFLGSSLISWSVKKQNTVARSSTEAEYRALASAAAEITWIRRLLQELNCTQEAATPLFCDNTSAIALANNPVFHARTKHIEVDCHYIRNCVKDHIIQIQHISTKDQLADLLTKSLPSTRFQFLTNKLMKPPDSSS
ncbi:Retrovirus-related Pol polyprotein from transposon TNT 1-94 [Dendrobium catenatum]|uniref:Retrovirus-related Pol polyprotein from transposon TNT 1-94 n=1 Tax=Dendrobium catenatum TaxID=906689 RepID=A0A2I0VI50_9ASPA|nr:Retrovirus-related Pol polyprotein from transposon TNT 1-94 [Dendrobium catenatum]